MLLDRLPSCVALPSFLASLPGPLTEFDPTTSSFLNNHCHSLLDMCGLSTVPLLVSLLADYDHFFLYIYMLLQETNDRGGKENQTIIPTIIIISIPLHYHRFPTIPIHSLLIQIAELFGRIQIFTLELDFNQPHQIGTEVSTFIMNCFVNHQYYLPPYAHTRHFVDLLQHL